MTKFYRIALALSLLLFVTACEQVGDEFNELIGEEDPGDIGDDAPLYDLNGRFSASGSQGCVKDDGQSWRVPPDDVVITQAGNSLTMEIVGSGVLHVGHVSGDRFYVSGSGKSRIFSSHCDYEFYGKVHDDNSLSGVEEADCVSDVTITCPDTRLNRIAE